MATRGGTQRWFRILFLVLLVAGLMVPAYGWWSRNRTVSIAAACHAEIASEHWSKAQPLAEEWVRRNPEDADAWLSLAEIAKSQGDLSATAECLSRIRPTDEHYLNSQMLRGDLLLDGLKRPAEATEVWKSMLVVAPNANVAHQRLLYVYSMTLQRELMVKQIREAIHQHAEPSEAYGYILSAPNLMFTDGYVKVGQWLEASPENESLRVAHAVFAARANPSKAMKMFGTKAVEAGDATGVKKCLKDFPDNLELRAFVIEKAIAEADMTAVGKALQNLPQSAEDDSRFWRYIGTFRDSQRRTTEAADAFRQSIQLHPMDWKSHHELGTVERVLGHAELAAKHADLGSRGKQLERQIMELPNAAQADVQLLVELRQYARDCGDQDVVDGLSYRLPLAGDKNAALIR